MSSLHGHLVLYARSQLEAIKGWQGAAYVERCLILWEETYGPAVAAAVRAQLKADK